MRINDVILQSPSMASYASAYNDFVIVDGTFLVTAYDLKLIIATTVDCLGKSVTVILCDKSLCNKPQTLDYE
jgi:hypothetical protein